MVKVDMTVVELTQVIDNADLAISINEIWKLHGKDDSNDHIKEAIAILVDKQSVVCSVYEFSFGYGKHGFKDFVIKYIGLPDHKDDTKTIFFYPDRLVVSTLSQEREKIYNFNKVWRSTNQYDPFI